MENKGVAANLTDYAVEAELMLLRICFLIHPLSHPAKGSTVHYGLNVPWIMGCFPPVEGPFMRQMAR